MKYGHILAAVAAEIWAVDAIKLEAVIGFLTLQASGEKFSAEEIEAKIAPQTAKAVARREGAVAIVPMRGVIANRMPLVPNSSTGGGASSEQIGAQLRQAIDDEGVKAIIIDCDSPGGNVQGTDEVSEIIVANRGNKPIVAQVAGDCASAAYWACASCDEIVMTASSEIGSIGVYTVRDDITVALEKLGIKKEVIGAGKFKGEMAPFLAFSDEARAYTQSRVDAYYDMFVGRVAAGRGFDTDAVRNGFGQGRMVGATQAVKMRMADRIGTMQDTLARFGVSASVAPRTGAFATQREKHALLL